ncbi:hypothetical protein JCM6882_008550 [Rhodosporidiobolus microsporus]
MGGCDVLPLPTLAHRLSLSRRDERRFLPYVLAGCFLLLLYVQPHRPDPALYQAAFDRLSFTSSSSFPDIPSASSFSPITPTSLRALLLPRLARVAAAPILSYDASLALESARCPLSYRQANRDQLRGEGEEWWPTVSVEELEEGRGRVVERVREVFEGVNEEKLQEMLGTGERGLVFTAGNKDTMLRLLTSLRILRVHHRCALPVEIFGFPSELRALDQGVKKRIEELGGVEWREIEGEKVEGRWKQFQIKGEAIARSSFSEILYLDSDNIALTDPSFLFDSPLYKKHGIVLWPDFNRDSAANPIFRLLSHPCDPAAWQAETGQLLVDKRARGGMNLAALEVARGMMAESGFWFHMSGGDKDTFRYAFYLLSLPLSFAPHYPSALGASLPSSYAGGHTFCGHTMVQYGLDAGAEWARLRERGEVDEGFATGEHAPPLFAHANVLKHSGYNNRRGSTFLHLKNPVDDRLFPPSFSFLSPSDPPLSSIRQSGFPHRGICVDLWDFSSPGGAGEREEGAGEGAYEKGEVEVLEWGTAWGGVGRGLEEVYYGEGGRAGAW